MHYLNIFQKKTNQDQSKIAIQLEKLTSTSIQIKWNHVTFNNIDATIAMNNAYYKLEYWTKAMPEQVLTHDKLKSNELFLTNLKPNTDYIVQIVGYLGGGAVSSGGGGGGGGGGSNSLMTSEPALKHFRTLISNIEAPANLQVIRFEPDKINIKWDRVVMLDQNGSQQKVSLIKGYKIYYKEIVKDTEAASSASSSSSSSSVTNPIYEDDTLNYYMDSSDEWKVIEQNGDQNTQIILEDLHVNRDYAIKVIYLFTKKYIYSLC
jgi:hypothetical protein